MVPILFGQECGSNTPLVAVDTPRQGMTMPESLTGQYVADIQKMLDILHRLEDTRHTAKVIEHNLDVVKTADWVLDL